MTLNLFARKKISFSFSDQDWKYDDLKRNYCLKINAGKTRLNSNSKISLYKLQGALYIFMSEGFETISDNLIIYFAQFPFGGKIVIK